MANSFPTVKVTVDVIYLMKREGKGRDVGMRKGKVDGQKAEQIKEGVGKRFMVDKTPLFVGHISSC